MFLPNKEERSAISVIDMTKSDFLGARINSFRCTFLNLFVLQDLISLNIYFSWCAFIQSAQTTNTICIALSLFVLLEAEMRAGEHKFPVASCINKLNVLARFRRCYWRELHKLSIMLFIQLCF